MRYEPANIVYFWKQLGPIVFLKVAATSRAEIQDTALIIAPIILILMSKLRL